MKRLIPILFILLRACSNPTMPPPEAGPSDPELVGTWTRGTLAWEFTADHVVTQYSTTTGAINVYVWYVAYPAEGRVYLEEFFDGSNGFYLYSIDGLVLSMTPEWIPGAGATYWDKVVE